MNLYRISPFCLAGADGEAENFDNLAALTAKLLRQESPDEISSRTFAATTFPCGSTVIITVTSPHP